MLPFLFARLQKNLMIGPFANAKKRTTLLQFIDSSTRYRLLFCATSKERHSLTSFTRT